jgi:hypothetical protein
MTTPAEAGGRTPRRSAGSRRVPSEIFAVIGPVTLATGLLYYFGYVSARAYYAYFGIGLSALDFDPTSYLARSPVTLFKPITTILLLAFVLLLLHHAVVFTLKRAGTRAARIVAVTTVGLGLVSCVVGLVGLYGPPLGVLAPTALGAFAVLVEYGLWTATRCSALPAWLGQAAVAHVTGLRRAILVLVLVLSVFWAVSNLAEERGLAGARLTEQVLAAMPRAVVYSDKDLQLTGPGITVSAPIGADQAKHFRYAGLRPLLYAGGKWFLLPAGWRAGSGSTVLILQPDPIGTRVELAP